MVRIISYRRDAMLKRLGRTGVETSPIDFGAIHVIC